MSAGWVRVEQGATAAYMYSVLWQLDGMAVEDFVDAKLEEH